MAIAPITQWLSTPFKQYAVGVALYDKYGDNILLKTLFKNGSSDSDYHLTRLIESLELLNRQLKEIDNKKPAIPQTFQIPELSSITVPAQRFGLTDSEYEKAPDAIKDVYTENSRLKSRADLLYMQVRSEQVPSERLKLALAQLDDRDRLNENWKKIKAFFATGQLEEKIAEDIAKIINDLPISDVIKLSNNLPTYITKAKPALAEMQEGSAKYEKKKAKLIEFEVKLRLVKERLANV